MVSGAGSAGVSGLLAAVASIDGTDCCGCTATPPKPYIAEWRCFGSRSPELRCMSSACTMEKAFGFVLFNSSRSSSSVGFPSWARSHALAWIPAVVMVCARLLSWMNCSDAASFASTSEAASESAMVSGAGSAGVSGLLAAVASIDGTDCCGCTATPPKPYIAEWRCFGSRSPELRCMSSACTMEKAFGFVLFNSSRSSSSVGFPSWARSQALA